MAKASTDGGNTWTQVNYSGDPDGVFTLQEGFWQTMVITLFEFGGISDVRLRFTWSDAGSWASGFAVDNVVVGDLEEFSLTLDLELRHVLGSFSRKVSERNRRLVPVSRSIPHTPSTGTT